MRSPGRRRLRGAAGRSIVRGLFGDDRVVDFVTSTCDHWQHMAAARDKTDTFGEKLWTVFGAATGVCRELLGSLLVLTPHSMGTERTVSHFNSFAPPTASVWQRIRQTVVSWQL